MHVRYLFLISIGSGTHDVDAHTAHDAQDLVKEIAAKERLIDELNGDVFKLKTRGTDLRHRCTQLDFHRYGYDPRFLGLQSAFTNPTSSSPPHSQPHSQAQAHPQQQQEEQTGMEQTEKGLQL